MGSVARVWNNRYNPANIGNWSSENWQRAAVGVVSIAAVTVGVVFGFRALLFLSRGRRALYAGIPKSTAGSLSKVGVGGISRGAGPPNDDEIRAHFPTFFDSMRDPPVEVSLGYDEIPGWVFTPRDLQYRPEVVSRRTHVLGARRLPSHGRLEERPFWYRLNEFGSTDVERRRQGTFFVVAERNEMALFVNHLMEYAGGGANDAGDWRSVLDSAASGSEALHVTLLEMGDMFWRVRAALYGAWKAPDGTVYYHFLIKTGHNQDLRPLLAAYLKPGA